MSCRDGKAVLSHSYAGILLIIWPHPCTAELYSPARMSWILRYPWIRESMLVLKAIVGKQLHTIPNAGSKVMTSEISLRPLGVLSWKSVIILLTLFHNADEASPWTSWCRIHKKSHPRSCPFKLCWLLTAQLLKELFFTMSPWTCLLWHVLRLTSPAKTQTSQLNWVLKVKHLIFSYIGVGVLQISPDFFCEVEHMGLMLVKTYLRLGSSIQAKKNLAKSKHPPLCRKKNSRAVPTYKLWYPRPF